MGMGYYCVLEQPIQGVDPLAVDGKALARAHAHSQSSPNHANSPLSSLDEFFSINPEEALAFAEGEGIDLGDVSLPPVNWNDPNAGLNVVVELLAKFRDKSLSISLPDSAPDSRERVVADLEGIEAVLKAAAKQGVRFYLTCDSP